ncbi:MAG: arylesterase [Rhodobacter sp.]|nr:arylesterase [Rhodobacter sp.]
MRALRNLCGAVLLAGTAQAEPVVIAALGDSLTQGYGLVPEDGFVPQLERWLVAQGAEARVLNAGVSGDTTQGGLSRVDWTLTPEVDAMIVALGGNDLLRGIDPAVSRANLAGILQAADGAEVEVMLVGLTAPGNYGPDFKRDFDAMYPELAAEFGALHVASFLGPLSERAEEAGAVQRYMQADGIHPNAEGVALIVEGLGPAVLELIARVE